MIIRNTYLTLQLNDENGSIVSIHNGQREFILQENVVKPLFKIRLRGERDVTCDVSSLQADTYKIISHSSEEKKGYKMSFNGFPGLDLSVEVTVRMTEHEPFTYWRLSLENNTGMYVDWIDFPGIIVPNDLPAANGSSVILWPAMEGVFIEDAAFREESWLKYSPVEYPNKGWEGYYPGPCPIQMMAYYNEKGGLYFAAHDRDFNVKAIEFYSQHTGIKLEYRLFPGAIIGSYTMAYDMVIGTFSGDWYDAAEIYRNWREQVENSEMIKLCENNHIPSWFEESPITAIYPVRGQMHMGDMTPNQDYYPFTSALPHIESLSKNFESQVMALPMQWEGTAPWAPPYVWPPLGGEENFKAFVEGLHQQGNLAGVYCSGIAWTNESMLMPGYSRRKQFEEEHLIDVMCDSPEGGSPRSAICQEPIRSGYDMCPANRFVHETAIGEVRKIVQSGCDYVQFFDQNLGGASYFCYSKKHGHPPAPGHWQIEAMKELMMELQQEVQCSEREVAVGCESAAAEPYIPYLSFNDLRFEINYMIGTPVPLYAYIYHEYVNNFMGNQNMACGAIQFSKSPMNILQRLAYSFIAGDLLTVVLADAGQIHWDWCTPWEVEKPNQEWVIQLIRNLNSWRKGKGKAFLCYGKMQKPFRIERTYDIPMTLYNGKQLHIPSLLTSRWMSPDGRDAQIVVNYTGNIHEFALLASGTGYTEALIHENSIVVCEKTLKGIQDKLVLTVRPLSAILIEFF